MKEFLGAGKLSENLFVADPPKKNSSKKLLPKSSSKKSSPKIHPRKLLPKNSFKKFLPKNPPEKFPIIS